MKKTIFVTKTSMPPYDEFCEAIKPLWESHWLTNMGIYHKQLEMELGEYLDVPEVSLIVNGHMALEMTIQAFDFPLGGEVITTPFTFVSTTHAIVRNGLNPVFCDIKSTDGTIDETKIENLITEKTVAILPVHVYGNICDVEKIKKISEKYSLKVIYDAAHAFGVQYKDKGIGNYGDASIFSFHATKVYNTIEGGAVVCKNHDLYEKLYNLKNFGIRGEEVVVSVGANAKMNEFSAIMGLLNLKYIDDAIKDRKRVHDYYNNQLPNIDGISVFVRNEEVMPNYAYYPILLQNEFVRNYVYDKLKEQGIFTRKYFYPLTADQACFKNKYRDSDIMIARNISERVLVLPIFEGITKDDLDMIISKIQECLRSYKN